MSKTYIATAVVLGLVIGAIAWVFQGEATTPSSEPGQVYNQAPPAPKPPAGGGDVNF